MATLTAKAVMGATFHHVIPLQKNAQKRDSPPYFFAQTQTRKNPERVLEKRVKTFLDDNAMASTSFLPFPL